MTAATIVRIAEDAQARGGNRLRDHFRAVRGAVVDDDEFPISVERLELLQQVADGVIDDRRLVEKRADQADRDAAARRASGSCRSIALFGEEPGHILPRWSTKIRCHNSSDKRLKTCFACTKSPLNVCSRSRATASGRNQPLSRTTRSDNASSTKIGRASCRERGEDTGGAGYLK